ncbi:hypothetical protein ABPG75_012621 [Micractinium tetrahymenae]
MSENESAGANCLLHSGARSPGKSQEAPDSTLGSLPPALLDRIREELTCCVCLDLAARPASLPCGHNACRRCLDAMFASAPQNERCPNCRAPLPPGMPALEINASLKNLVEMLWPDECRERSRSPSPEAQWRGRQRVHALSPAVPARDRLARGRYVFRSLQTVLTELDVAATNAQRSQLVMNAFRTSLATIPATAGLPDPFSGSPAVAGALRQPGVAPTAGPAPKPGSPSTFASFPGAAPLDPAQAAVPSQAEGRQPSSLAETQASLARRRSPLPSRRRPMQAAAAAAQDAAAAAAAATSSSDAASSGAGAASAEAAFPASPLVTTSLALPAGMQQHMSPAMHSRLQLAEGRLARLRADAAARRRAAAAAAAASTPAPGPGAQATAPAAEQGAVAGAAGERPASSPTQVPPH